MSHWWIVGITCLPRPAGTAIFFGTQVQHGFTVGFLILCDEDTNLNRNVDLCPHGYRRKAPESGLLALHIATDIVGHVV